MRLTIEASGQVDRVSQLDQLVDLSCNLPRIVVEDDEDEEEGRALHDELRALTAEDVIIRVVVEMLFLGQNDEHDAITNIKGRACIHVDLKASDHDFDRWVDNK